MSSIATKFSSASTKLQVGVAAVAVVAAATLTPAIAEATPSIAPITLGTGSSIVLDDWVGSSAPGEAKTAAVVGSAAITAFTPFTIVNGVIETVANWFYSSLTFIGNTINYVANRIAFIFKVGPYATGK